MLSFPYVDLLAPGDAVTSPQLAKLADAVNSRLRSGIGDGTWRILWYFFNLWRNIRRPSETGAEPPQAEFLEFYQHIDPESGVTWPETSFDEPEGIRTANPMGAFIGGNQVGVESEDVRLLGEDPENPLHLWFDTGAPTNATERWNIGRSQRGVYDPATGGQNVPAISAAQSYNRIAHTQFYHKAYGGFQPTPRQIGDCGDADAEEGVMATPKFKFIFTSLTGLPSKSYTGICPTDSPGGRDPNNVVYIARMPFAYYIFFSARPTERLPVSEWIEGPYQTGGVLQKTDGGQLTRIALNNYIKDYRGSEGQRDLSDEGKQFDTYDLSEIAFDFERFFTGQYFLSPVIGHTNGNKIETDYPGFIWDAASYAAGSLARYLGDGSTAHQIADGFVYAGALIRGYGLQNPVNVEVLNGSTVLATVSLTEGDSSQISMLDNAGKINLKFRLASAVTFAAGGRIQIEAAELLEYKPAIHDAYLILRLHSTQGDALSFRVDGRGRDSTDAKAFSDSYFGNGMIVNGRAAGLPLQGIFGINDNPVFDAARAFTREHVRITNRRQFIGYEVNDEGKSVLYFLRHAYSSDNDNPVDTFWNIAPSKSAVVTGRIRQGYTYQVRGTGSVHYPTDAEAVALGVTAVDYTPGQTFAGISGATGFLATGGAEVFQHEGILPVAPRLGETNEWLMFVQFKAYHQSLLSDETDTSVWSISGYADYITFSNRCQFYSPSITPLDKPELVRHFQYGQYPILSPEAPTGYNYADGTNRFRTTPEDVRLNFYKSCQIYQPDDEIESATVSFDGGQEVVKLVFKTRFQHCDEAPATIPRLVEAWDIDALRAEPYRTTENGLREYLVWRVKSLHPTPGRTGDAAAESSIWTENDNPFGTIFPTFFFTHLVPKPSEDDPPNETIQSDQDTRCLADPLIQTETYLYAMCQGYVDGVTSAAFGCGATVQDPPLDPVPAFTAEFKPGSPLSNYLLMADDVHLPAPFLPAGTSFTCGTWVKFRSKDTVGADLIARWQGGNNEQFNLGHDTATDQFFCWVRSPGFVDTTFYAPVGAGVTLNEWYHVAMQLDIPNNALRIFVNGVRTEMVYTGGMKGSGAGMIVGFLGQNPGGRMFDGWLKGTFLDKTVWDAGDIDRLYRERAHIADFVPLDLPLPTVWYEYDNAAKLGDNYLPESTHDLSNFTGTNGPVVQSVQLEDVPSPVITYQGGMFDYTFESLCYEAFGGRWINTVSTTVRPDKPQGFGPLPNTVMYAEIYNQLAKCLNLLDKARIMLPFELQCRTNFYATERPITPDWADGATVCPVNGTNKAIWSGTPPAASDWVSATDWDECLPGVINSYSSGGFDPTDQCIAGSWKLRSIKNLTSYRFKLVDPLALNAVPPNVRDLITQESFGFLAQKITTRTVSSFEIVTDSSKSEGCCPSYQEPCPGFFFDSTLGYGWKFTVRDYASPPVCGLYTSGTLPVADPPAGAFSVCRRIGDPDWASANGTRWNVDLIPLGEQPTVYLLVPLSGAPVTPVTPGPTAFPGTVDTSAPVDTSTPI